MNWNLVWINYLNLFSRLIPDEKEVATVMFIITAIIAWIGIIVTIAYVSDQFERDKG